jgi:hypothetical protein
VPLWRLLHPATQKSPQRRERVRDIARQPAKRVFRSIAARRSRHRVVREDSRRYLVTVCEKSRPGHLASSYSVANFSGSPAAVPAAKATGRAPRPAQGYSTSSFAHAADPGPVARSGASEPHATVNDRARGAVRGGLLIRRELWAPARLPCIWRRHGHVISGTFQNPEGAASLACNWTRQPLGE